MSLRLGDIVSTKGFITDIESDVSGTNFYGVKLFNCSYPDLIFFKDDGLTKKETIVIPKCVAEWIEQCKLDEMQSLSSAISNSAPEDVSNWLSLNDCQNEEVFAKAWLYGYKVEKEKQYWVRHPLGESMLYKESDGKIVTSSGQDIDFQVENRDDYLFTEKEIKDYDERYWAFAVEVEE